MTFYLDSIARPAKSGEYYVITEGGTHKLLPYSAEHHAWNVRDNELYDADLKMTSIYCWACKPKTHKVLLSLKED